MAENAICTFCTFMSSTAVLRLHRGDDFRFLVDFIVRKWPELSHLDFRITYSIEGCDNVRLEDDSDIDLMVNHHLDVGSSRIYVVISLKDNGHVHVAPVRSDSCIAPLVERPNVEVGSSSNIVDMDDNVGDSSSLMTRSNSGVELLSDQWSLALKEVGQYFEGGAMDFRMKLAKYAIEMGFDYVLKRNNTQRVLAKCAVDGCPWIIRARSDTPGGIFYIKKWHRTHSCNGGIRTVKHKKVSSNLVAELFHDQIMSKPDIRAIDIQQQMKIMYGLDVSYYHAWRGKEKAISDVQGDESLSFDRLRWYDEAIMTTNPGSIMSLEYDKFTGRFQRYFVAFDACVEGFKSCRPMLFLDGTFLKSRYKGAMLCATGKNGNQGFFPLCFGIVDAENQNNWIWFMLKLVEVLEGRQNVVFISDRNKGLLDAVGMVFPNSHHGFCLEHLKQNLRTKISVYKGHKLREKLVSMFVDCAHAHTISEFNEKMELFKSRGGGHVLNFLKDTPLKNWANTYFNGCRYGEMTSNSAESFNAWIKDERSLPIDVLVDRIRRKLMEQMAKRLIKGKAWQTILCPKMEKRLQEVMRVGRNWKVIRSNEHIFEVLSTPSCSVNLEARTCDCREWEDDGFPCGHAVVAIQYDNGDVYAYCDPYFRTSSFVNSYAKCIYPITSGDSSISLDDAIVIKAPVMKRQPGRPKRKRGVPQIEQLKKTIKCTRCKKVGNHNRRSCKETIGS